jgi:prepilin-type N-terminal cleavage/methylation domain-containing protein
MRPLRTRTVQSGFTLIELMVSVAIFLLICGAIFELMGTTQNRFKTESQVLGAFEEARLGLDQIVRDVNDAGYPPQNHFSTTTVSAANFAASPIAWGPNYVAGTPCLIGTAGGGTCTSPGDFDLIVEGDVDGSGVEWIRYQLAGTTLFRGVVLKTVNTEPVAATSAAGVMLPYVLNVMNNAPPAQIAQFQAAYPAMFPGGIPVPIFNYTLDPAVGPAGCTAAASSPCNVRDVDITLIVMTPNTDAQTNQIHLVELNGRGHRVNPNQ